jgi:hypothetical protein
MSARFLTIDSFMVSLHMSARFLTIDSFMVSEPILKSTFIIMSTSSSFATPMANSLVQSVSGKLSRENYIL